MSTPRSIKVEVDIEALAEEIAEKLADMLRKEGLKFTMSRVSNKIIISIDILGMISMAPGPTTQSRIFNIKTE